MDFIFFQIHENILLAQDRQKKAYDSHKKKENIYF